jgi:GNAT superfamily N-acetyltransferase
VLGVTALFSVGCIRATELALSDVTALQAFFEANPEYFVAISGEPPLPSAAREEFDDLPPADMPFSGRWLLGFYDDTGSMIGFTGVLSDLLAKHVWHIGIFIVATRLHGIGLAANLYQALEGWMKSNGAQWIRLGVVEGNAKAKRFWHKLGYVEVRKRSGVTMGKRSNTVRVLFKALAGGTSAQYLSRVARDDPDSALR